MPTQARKRNYSCLDDRVKYDELNMKPQGSTVVLPLGIPSPQRRTMMDGGTSAHFPESGDGLQGPPQTSPFYFQTPTHFEHAVPRSTHINPIHTLQRPQSTRSESTYVSSGGSPPIDILGSNRQFGAQSDTFNALRGRAASVSDISSYESRVLLHPGTVFALPLANFSPASRLEGPFAPPSPASAWSVNSAHSSPVPWGNGWSRRDSSASQHSVACSPARSAASLDWPVPKSNTRQASGSEGRGARMEFRRRSPSLFGAQAAGSALTEALGGRSPQSRTNSPHLSPGHYAAGIHRAASSSRKRQRTVSDPGVRPSSEEKAKGPVNCVLCTDEEYSPPQIRHFKQHMNRKHIKPLWCLWCEHKNESAEMTRHLRTAHKDTVSDTNVKSILRDCKEASDLITKLKTTMISPKDVGFEAVNRIVAAETVESLRTMEEFNTSDVLNIYRASAYMNAGYAGTDVLRMQCAGWVPPAESHAQPDMAKLVSPSAHHLELESTRTDFWNGHLTSTTTAYSPSVPNARGREEIAGSGGEIRHPLYSQTATDQYFRESNSSRDGQLRSSPQFPDVSAYTGQGGLGNESHVTGSQGLCISYGSFSFFAAHSDLNQSIQPGPEVPSFQCTLTQYDDAGRPTTIPVPHPAGMVDSHLPGSMEVQLPRRSSFESTPSLASSHCSTAQTILGAGLEPTLSVTPGLGPEWAKRFEGLLFEPETGSDGLRSFGSLDATVAEYDNLCLQFLHEP